jgi:hypothetical protein
LLALVFSADFENRVKLSILLVWIVDEVA